MNKMIQHTETFIKNVKEMLKMNEISGNDSIATRISHAGTENSGYSFGFQQMDLASNSKAKHVLKDIVDNYLENPDNAKELESREGFFESVEWKLLTKGDPTGKPHYLNGIERNVIDKALASDYSKSILEAQFDKSIDSYIDQVDNFETELGHELTEGQRLMLIDYRNQYEPFDIFPNNKYTMFGHLTSALRENGEITNEDLATFLRNTEHANNPKHKAFQNARIDRTLKMANEIDSRDASGEELDKKPSSPVAPETQVEGVELPGIPETSETPEPSLPETYVIQAGDTLTKIAAQYGISVEALAKHNNIENINLIEKDATLNIPQPVTTEQAPQESETGETEETPEESPEPVTTEPLVLQDQTLITLLEKALGEGLEHNKFFTVTTDESYNRVVTVNPDEKLTINGESITVHDLVETLRPASWSFSQEALDLVKDFGVALGNQYYLNQTSDCRKVA